MPYYPCAECDDLVDTHSHTSCPHCGAKRPFQCSKCGKKMNQVDIFQLEKLKTKKPLLCMDCGRANEVVKCGICKSSLVRSHGLQVNPAPDAKVYHRSCYDKQTRTLGMARKIAPVVGGVGILAGLGMLATTGFHHFAGPLFVAGLFIGGALLIGAIAEVFTPR